LNPDIRDRDKGHDRSSGIGEISDIDAEVGDHAIGGGADGGTVEIELGTFEIDEGLFDLGIVLSGATEVAFGFL